MENFPADNMGKSKFLSAGGTMRVFLDKYVKEPLKEILAAKTDNLPLLMLSLDDTEFSISMDGEKYSYPRIPDDAIGEIESDKIPDDVNEE